MVNFKPTPNNLIDIITHICGKSPKSRSDNANVKRERRNYSLYLDY